MRRRKVADNHTRLHLSCAAMTRHCVNMRHTPDHVTWHLVTRPSCGRDGTTQVCAAFNPVSSCAVNISTETSVGYSPAFGRRCLSGACLVSAVSRCLGDEAAHRTTLGRHLVGRLNKQFAICSGVIIKPTNELRPSGIMATVWQ